MRDGPTANLIGIVGNFLSPHLRDWGLSLICETGDEGPHFLWDENVGRACETGDSPTGNPRCEHDEVLLRAF